MCEAICGTTYIHWHVIIFAKPGQYVCKTCIRLYLSVSICINLYLAKAVSVYINVYQATCIRGQRWRSRCCQRNQSASQEAGQSIAKGSFKNFHQFVPCFFFQETYYVIPLGLRFFCIYKLLWDLCRLSTLGDRVSTHIVRVKPVKLLVDLLSK